MTNKADPFDLAAGVPKIEGDLRPAPKVAERISKRVLMVVFGLVAIVTMTFLVALDAMDKKGPKPAAEKKVENKSPGSGAPPPDLMSEGTPKLAGADDKDLGDLLKGADPKPASETVSATPGLLPVPKISEVPPDIPRAPPLTPEQQRALAEEQARHQRNLQARTQGMSAKPFGGAGDEANPANQLTALMEQAKKAMGDSAGGVKPASFMEGGGAKQAEGDQERKMEFLTNAGKESHGYHPHISLPALSSNEIKTGTFIPMVLEQSINSDLPGQITARVTEDVYDTITGCRMLIPAMSKVVGRYDSKVALGQGRMLVAWNSMVFRDGAELNLAGLQGYDVSGQAGLESDVDNHYWRLFGLTFGLSMITSGVQLSVPQPNPSPNGAAPAQTPSQIVATSLAQQYGALGSQIISKYMSVQPTLRNYVGERFVLMVPRTIVFKKVWRNRCANSM